MEAYQKDKRLKLENFDNNLANSENEKKYGDMCTTVASEAAQDFLFHTCLVDEDEEEL